MDLKLTHYPANQFWSTLQVGHILLPWLQNQNDFLFLTGFAEYPFYFAPTNDESVAIISGIICGVLMMIIAVVCCFVCCYLNHRSNQGILICNYLKHFFLIVFRSKTCN